MSGRRTIQWAVIVALAAGAGVFVGMGFAMQGVGAGLARAAFVGVVLPSVMYVVLGPALCRALLSLMYPHPDRPAEGYCPRCGYDQRGNADPTRCPECGEVIPSELRRGR